MPAIILFLQFWLLPVALFTVDPLPGPPPAHSLPIFVTSYNPELGGINCNQECETMAGGHKVADWYGRAAACLPEWYGKMIVIPGFGEFWCLDRGGAVNVRFDPAKGGWVVMVDVLSREPIHNGPFPLWYLLDDSGRRWPPWHARPAWLWLFPL